MNDGRPPDTTKQLVQKRVGRPKGARNLKPGLCSDMDTSSFGIPWGFEYKGFHAINTCSMDTGLMALYMLNKYCGMSEASDLDGFRQVAVFIAAMAGNS